MVTLVARKFCDQEIQVNLCCNVPLLQFPKLSRSRADLPPLVTKGGSKKVLNLNQNHSSSPKKLIRNIK